MNFASKKVFFPDKSDVIKQPFCFSRMRTSQNFDFVISEPISIYLYPSPFFLRLSSLLVVFGPLYRFFAWKCVWPTFKNRYRWKYLLTLLLTNLLT